MLYYNKMSNKRIEINPALFSMNGANKTKKKREKITKQIATPLISPNVLKNKLLKRIKDHKNRENNIVSGGKNNEEKNEHINNNTFKTTNANDNGNVSNITNVSNVSNDVFKYSEEFNDSISYLQSLSKEKKMNDEKTLYEKQKEKRREELHRSTLKNHFSLASSQYSSQSHSPFVYNELPEDLKEPLIKIDTQKLTINNEPPVNLKYRVDSIVPYGVLKGGMKPTMREWNKTQRNRDIISNTSINTNTSNSSNSSNNERENKLNALKEKIKEKQKQQQLRQQQQDIQLQQLHLQQLRDQLQPQPQPSTLN